MAERNDLIDIVILSKRGASAIQAILTEASQTPSAWIRHQFIVVFSNTGSDAVQELGNWYKQKRQEMPLPNVIARQAPDSVKNLSTLRQYAVGLGKNPYIYFQDDDDPLPHGIDMRIDMMRLYNWDAIYGVTESFNHTNHTVERFPAVDASGRFVYNPHKGMLLFPTFFHPWAALFNRRLFADVAIDDGQMFYLHNAAFAVRLMNSDARVTFLPDIMRRVRHHDTNTTGIVLNLEERNKIAEDIRMWRKYVADADVLAFQDTVARHLEDGTITTFKEIDSMVESYLDDAAQGLRS